MDGHIRFSPYKSADADANFTEIADADADIRFIITADADVKKLRMFRICGCGYPNNL